MNKDRIKHIRALRTILITAALIIGMFVLQSTVFRSITFGGIGPNLMIIVACSLGLLEGDIKGLLVGFFCGLICDIFYNDVIGFYALAYALTGFLSGEVEKLVFPKDLKVPLLTILAGDFLYGFLSYVFQFLIRGRIMLQYFLVHFVFPEMLYTFLIAMLLYPLILMLYTKYMRPIRESEINYARKKTQN